MQRKHLIVGIAALGLAAWWWHGDGDGGDGGGRGDETPAGGSDTRPQARTINPDLAEALGKARSRSGTITFGRHGDDGGVTISGKVVDVASRAPVGGVEVVLRSPQGEESTSANADGTYAIHVPLGIYRVFVRDDKYVSVGRVVRQRLPGPPAADAVGLPDELLMPQVLANADVGNVELAVDAAGTITGKVVDGAGKPVPNAIVYAEQARIRPVLGTDAAETDEHGAFELRVPASYTTLQVSHPRYAGVAAREPIEVPRGGSVDTTLTVSAGCVIAGKVITADGSPASDGAMERRWGETEREYGPAGRIEADGTFRWTTFEHGDVRLRAWPWKSAPSQPATFACTEGARYQVTFQIPNVKADIEGTLVDATGQPVRNAFIDLAPLDAGGIGQQERTDNEGRWQVFAMPSGRYRLTAHAAGGGVASVEVRSPESGVVVTLGGTGRLEGTTPNLADGSFELDFGACAQDDDSVAMLEGMRRLVTVTEHHFAVEDVPACAHLTAWASWNGRGVRIPPLTVTAGQITQVEVAIGPAPRKQIHGRVTLDGRPVANASVYATPPPGQPGLEGFEATTDATGAYTLEVLAGSSLLVTLEARPGTRSTAVVGAKAGDETIDIALTAPDTTKGEGEGGDVIDEPDVGGDEDVPEGRVEAIVF